MHLLSVFTSVPAGVTKREFNAWYDREHIPERLGIPGVLWAARYELEPGPYEYAALYALESGDVLTSQEYRMLGEPANWSPATRQVFPAMSRAMLRCVARLEAGSLNADEILAMHLGVASPPASASIAEWAEAVSGRAWLSGASPCQDILHCNSTTPLPQGFVASLTLTGHLHAARRRAGG